MEARFGADFSDVRLHTDRAAQESAAASGARAYTSGSDVVVGQGGGDRHTLAHELTHVIQQRSGPVAGTDNGDGLRVSDPGDHFEREADQHATHVLAAAPPVPDGDGHGGHQHGQHGHDGHDHGHGPGATVQRVAVPATAAEQDDQWEEISALGVLWVPDEEFDPDGNLLREPRYAHAAPARGRQTDALRLMSAPLPRRAAGRRANVQDSWQVQFQTSLHIYTVEVVNVVQDLGGGRLRYVVDTDRPFRIVRFTAKGSGGRSMGRTFRYGDYWDVNPRYRGPGDPRRLAELRELSPEDRAPRDTTGLVPLPTDPSQPFLFYRRRVVDPNFTGPAGGSHDARDFLSGEDFDRRYAQTAPARTRSSVDVSRPPTVDRAAAGRDPKAAMGNVPAHALMPDTGHGGGGRLASHEWCHLIGDGDNGPSEFRNLVIGTNAVNTEQLAMETALRDYRNRFAGLGYAIRLTVRALLDRPEADEYTVPALARVPGGPYHAADWISFEIDVIDDPGRGARRSDVDRAAAAIGVHRQVMDARRGTITESEFTSLHHEVRNKLRRAHQELRVERERERSERRDARALREVREAMDAMDIDGPPRYAYY
jgi:hypothetical protein